MTKKILEIIIKTLIIILLAILVVFSYFILIDIETQEPEKVETSYNIETKQYQGRKIFVITPQEEKSETIILYFHGGSYIAEATQKHWEFLEQLTIDTKATIIMPDYPLAPKYSYKDVFEMIEPLYKEIVENIEQENLILMGDSAGGGLGLALLEKISQEHIAMPQKTVLISPWLDVRLTNSKIDEVQNKDTELNKETLKLAGIAYAGEEGINSYLVNPIDGNLSGLNNVTIFTGTDDILNPDVNLLQEKAKKVNVEIEVKEYENAKHIWIIEKNSQKELEEKGYQDLIECVRQRGQSKSVSHDL